MYSLTVVCILETNSFLWLSHLTPFCLRSAKNDCPCQDTLSGLPLLQGVSLYLVLQGTEEVLFMLFLGAWHERYGYAVLVSPLL